ncbi:MAG: chemotaxis protein CheD [Bacillota bacterium]
MINAGLKSQYIEEFKVGIADWKVTAAPHHIITLGLGSCVGIVLLDIKARVGGMVHIMLPDSNQFRNANNPAKFADTGIALLLKETMKIGARKGSIIAKIAGGAQMFKGYNSSLLNIGERNVNKTREVLEGFGIPLVSEDTGGHVGRTLILQNDTQKVFVRTIGNMLKEL